jgi:mannosylfructose-phosphate synthase
LRGANGLLIDPWDVDALSESVITLLNDRGLARKIGQNARETVEKMFTLPKFANKTAEFMRKSRTVSERLNDFVPRDLV